MNFGMTLRVNARRDPRKVAVVCGERSMTYGELDRRVDSLAHSLQILGVGPGDRVAVLLWNSIEFIEAYFAVMRLGAWFTPLNYRLSGDEILHALDHAEVRVLFTEERFHPTVQKIAHQARTPFTSVTTSGAIPSGWLSHQVLVSGSHTVSDAECSMDDVQRLMFTSGTTSRPRAAVVTHGQVHSGAMTRAAYFSLTHDDTSLSVGPLYHVGALDTFATTMLSIGGTVVLHDHFDAADVVTSLETHRVTNCWLAPVMLRQIVDVPDVVDRDLRALRVVVGGGEKAPLPLLSRIADLWPRVGYFDAYGLTECLGLGTVLPAFLAVEKRGSVGRTILPTELRLIDDDWHDVPGGSPGEVALRGPMVFPGYYKDDSGTNAALRDGWLRTGDVGQLDADGCLTIIDRKKDMIRSGGENIASSEVERVLNELPEVSEVAVIGIPDERWGEVPMAFVKLSGGHRLDEGVLRQHCASKLAKYKVPQRIREVDELPRNASAKVLKRTLREWAQQD